MFARQKTRDGRETDYGLGWMISERNGRKEIGHSGRQQRVSAHLYMLPDEGVAVALMANLEKTPLLDLARRIADIVLR